MTLDAFLAQEGTGGVNRLAVALSVTPSTVSKWRYGRLIPSLTDALAIEKQTDGKVTAQELVNTRAARKRRPLVPRKHVDPKAS